MKRCQAGYKWNGEECYPRLYLLVATDKAQQGGGYGRAWTVMYDGQPVMATTLDEERAKKVLKEASERSGIPSAQSIYDADIGKFKKMR